MSRRLRSADSGPAHSNNSGCKTRPVRADRAPRLQFSRMDWSFWFPLPAGRLALLPGIVLQVSDDCLAFFSPLHVKRHVVVGDELVRVGEPLLQRLFRPN